MVWVNHTTAVLQISDAYSEMLKLPLEHSTITIDRLELNNCLLYSPLRLLTAQTKNEKQMLTNLDLAQNLANVQLTIHSYLPILEHHDMSDPINLF